MVYDFNDLVALKELDDYALFEKISDVVENKNWGHLSKDAIREVLSEAISRNNVEILAGILCVTEVKTECKVTDLLIEASERNRDPFNAVCLAEQLFLRAEFENISEGVFLNIIDLEYDTVDLDGTHKEYGSIPKSYTSKHLLVRGDVENIDRIIEMYESPNQDPFVKFDLAAILYLETGRLKYFDFIKRGFGNLDFDISSYARGCFDVISA